MNQWFERKILEAQGKVTEMGQKVITRLPQTTVKQDCQMVLTLIRVTGVAQMRHKLMDGGGFYTDWMELPVGTVEEILKPYRDEPLFEKVMKRLKITWGELEEIAQVVAKEKGVV